VTPRRRRRPPLGRVIFSLRWEIGLPLLIAGALMAGLTVGVRGGDVLFWIGAGLAAVGAAVFFGAPRRS
jgi:hypothetical protein